MSLLQRDGHINGLEYIFFQLEYDEGVPGRLDGTVCSFFLVPKFMMVDESFTFVSDSSFSRWISVFPSSFR